MVDCQAISSFKMCLSGVSFCAFWFVSRWPKRDNKTPVAMRPALPRFLSDGKLTAAEALAAIQAFVASAVADGDVAAAWASRRVLLEVSDGIAQRFYFALQCGGLWVLFMAPAVGTGRFQIDDFGIFGEREFRHGPVYFFFSSSRRPGIASSG